MGKFIKIALVFIGGMTAGGYCVIHAALKSEFFTTALKNAITEKTTEVLYVQDSGRPKRDKSYYDAYWNGHIPKRVNHCVGNCDDIIFKTRKEAEYVLDSMDDIVRQYGVVSLADVYDLAGICSPVYAYNKYGWRSVKGATIVRCLDGHFYIKLPKPEEIK